MWDGLKGAVAGTWNQMAGFRNYAGGGVALGIGLDPVKSTAQGMTHSGYNILYNRAPGSLLPDPMRKIPLGGKGMRMLGSSVALGFGGWNVINGYQENGISGAKDAAVWEVAFGAAANRFAYGSIGTAGPMAGVGWRAKMEMLGAKTVGSRIVLGGGAGTLVGMGRFAGAGLGASVGQAVLGTPGAFIGGYIGAAPIRFAATHPLLALGMGLVGAAGAVGFGAAKAGGAVLEAGREHRQRQRSIDTSGSMAAFMTGNATTMRARAVQAMHKSHLNARSALGQEAGFMHMPSKNYHSGYR